MICKIRKECEGGKKEKFELKDLRKLMIILKNSVKNFM